MTTPMRTQSAAANSPAGTETAQQYEIVSVKNGKFHRPESTSFDGSANAFRDARLMRCGRLLVPLNFFETITDADKYTGRRLAKHICQQCEKKVSHKWRVPEVLKNGIPDNPANSSTRGDSEAVRDWGLEFSARDELAAYKLGYSYRNNPHGYKIETADAGDFVITVWNERAKAMGCDV